MTGELWVGLGLVVIAHIILHLHAEKRYRIAAAWLMTGAWALAGGFATECWVNCQTMEARFSRVHAAEPAEKMADVISIEPHRWSVPTDTGVLSFHGATLKESGHAVRATESSY